MLSVHKKLTVLAAGQNNCDDKQIVVKVPPFSLGALTTYSKYYLQNVTKCFVFNIEL